MAIKPEKRGPRPTEKPAPTDSKLWFYELEQHRVIQLKSQTLVKIVRPRGRKSPIDMEKLLLHANDKLPGGEKRSPIFDHFHLDADVSCPDCITLKGSIEELQIEGFIKAMEAFRR